MEMLVKFSRARRADARWWRTMLHAWWPRRLTRLSGLVIDEDDRPQVTRIEGAVTEQDINKGGWNTVHVIAKGNNFKFFINGKLSSEFTEHLPTEKRLGKGMIQLQLHDPGMIVHFKDIRLKILK